MYKILLPVDGSQHSLETIEETIKRAKAKQAEVTVLYVMEPLSISEYYKLSQSLSEADDIDGDILKENIQAMEQNLEERASFVLEKSFEKLNEHNINVNTMMEKGRPGEVICNVAEEDDFDLLIIGSKGFGLLGTLITLGSVTNEVIQHIKTSVLIVK